MLGSCHEELVPHTDAADAEAAAVGADVRVRETPGPRPHCFAAPSTVSTQVRTLARHKTNRGRRIQHLRLQAEPEMGTCRTQPSSWPDLAPKRAARDGKAGGCVAAERHALECLDSCRSAQPAQPKAYVHQVWPPLVRLRGDGL